MWSWAHRGVAEAWKEFPKKLVWWGLAGLGGLSLWALSHGFNVQSMWLEIKPFVDRIVPFLESNRKYWPAVLAACAVGAFFGLLYVLYAPTISVLLASVRHIQGVGLIGYFPAASKSLPAATAWEMMGSQAKTPHGREQMRILGASGWNTFAEKKAPFYSVLRSYPGRIEIALLHPQSPFLDYRAKSVGQDPEKYRAEITRTLKYLKALQSRNRSLKIGLYNAMPNWKMVMVGGLALHQYYRPGEHVQATPAILWEENGTDDCVYQQWWWEFERIWDGCRPPGTPIADYYKEPPVTEVRLSQLERQRREDASRVRELPAGERLVEIPFRKSDDDTPSPTQS